MLAADEPLSQQIIEYACQSFVCHDSTQCTQRFSAVIKFANDLSAHLPTRPVECGLFGIVPAGFVRVANRCLEMTAVVHECPIKLTWGAFSRTPGKCLGNEPQDFLITNFCFAAGEEMMDRYTLRTLVSINTAGWSYRIRQNCAGSVRPDTRQRHQPRQCIWEHTLLGNLLRGLPQKFSAAIIPQPLPLAQHIAEFGAPPMPARQRKQLKNTAYFGITRGTCVCCSMSSLTSILYGS